jgi:hypothetical protein
MVNNPIFSPKKCFDVKYTKLDARTKGIIIAKLLASFNETFEIMFIIAVWICITGKYISLSNNTPIFPV